MSADQLFVIESQLVLPSGELLLAGITPNWQVEIGPKRLIDEKYGQEEALCLLALIRYIDVPMQITELADRAVEIDKLATELGADPNPLIADTTDEDRFHNSVLETFGRLAINPDSHFRYNAMFLGARLDRRVWLLGNVQVFGYGERKIQDFTTKPGLADLRRNYLAFFDRKFRTLHPIAGEDEVDVVVDNVPIVEAKVSTPSGIVGVRPSKKPPLKIDAIDTRPLLPEETAVIEFGAKLRALDSKSEFTLDGIFEDNRIGVKAKDRLDLAVDLALEQGYIGRVSGNGRNTKYRRTDKSFKI